MDGLNETFICGSKDKTEPVTPNFYQKQPLIHTAAVKFTSVALFWDFGPLFSSFRVLTWKV